MKITKRVIAFVLSMMLAISTTGCGLDVNSKYRVDENLAEQEFCVAFRQSDKSGEAVIAALAVLQASGKVSQISEKWFGEDVSLLKGNPDALDNLTDKVEQRTFIVGYDADRLPFSGTDENGNAIGFDVDFAQAVCDQLGWKVKFLPIDVSQATVELDSGNVDCVWGGLAYDATKTKINQSPIYLKNTIVLASLVGSKVRSIGSLSGQTLTLSDNAYFNAVLEGNKALKSKPAYIVRVKDGTAGCFNALNTNSCGAIITDMAALNYYK
jgi:ABC-type amino acid transport substrate-binding protein